MSPLVIAGIAVWALVALVMLVALVVALRRPVSDQDRACAAIDQELDARERARRGSAERAARSALGYTRTSRVEASPRDCPVKPGPFGGA